MSARRVVCPFCGLHVWLTAKDTLKEHYNPYAHLGRGKRCPGSGVAPDPAASSVGKTK